jgi:hypothetical protein
MHTCKKCGTQFEDKKPDFYRPVFLCPDCQLVSVIQFTAGTIAFIALVWYVVTR